MRPRISHYKIVISGHIVEAFQYAKPIGYNLVSSRSKAEYRKRRKVSEQEITKSSLSRTRSRLIRLVNANARMWKKDGEIIKPQFLTYTFEENIKEVAVANPIFTNYIKRLNYHEGIKTKYVVVPEFQDRGAVHYHAIFFNLRMINARREFKTGEFAELWGQGYIKKKNVTNVPNIGIYMTKYMTKDATDRRLVGKKKYFSSRGLIKPKTINQEHLAEEIMDFLSEYKPVYGYITKPNEDNHYHPENPTFCATYNLNDEQLSQLLQSYSLSLC